MVVWPMARISRGAIKWMTLGAGKIREATSSSAMAPVSADSKMEAKTPPQSPVSSSSTRTITGPSAALVRGTESSRVRSSKLLSASGNASPDRGSGAIKW
jgi:hypothetical protein